MNDTGKLAIEIRRILTLALKIPANKYRCLDRATVPEWDSLKHIELVFALEDRFGVEFSDAEIPSLASEEVILRAIAARHAP
jgi:acyl carrier protein